MISAMSSNYMSYLGSGNVPRPLGSGFPTVVPYRVFEASDRPFSIAIGSEKLWSAFCLAIDRPDLEPEPDFANNARRVQNRHRLEAILAAEFRKRSMPEWVDRLRSVGIPCSPVRSFQEVAEDSQTALRNMFPTIACPLAGPQRVIGPAVKLSETPARVGTSAPKLGEHTNAALGELLGLDANQIQVLTESGVITQNK
jgi:crotonobetainyl-CoA:carnitine CoA-transferase CaiB-like acyl-CoA transferase